jgi:phosphatidate cytidylyltransferase
MSDVFRNFLILVTGCLAVAGIVLATLTWIFHRNVRYIWAIYGGWLVMVPILAACFWLGPAALIALVTVLALAGVFEFFRATGLSHDRPLMIVALALVFLTNGCALLTRADDGDALRLFLAIAPLSVAALLVIPILRNRSQGQLRAVSLAIFAYLYVGWMFGHLTILASSPHGEGYLLFFIFASEVNDIAAFTCGKLFGRRPLRSSISPRKTWEGALGAAAVSLALPWLLDFSFPPRFDGAHKLLIGLLIGVGGQVGDLVMSYIKRDLGVKDMGRAIPGHGGVLDRIDSMIFTAPLLTHLLNFGGLL